MMDYFRAKIEIKTEICEETGVCRHKVLILEANFGDVNMWNRKNRKLGGILGFLFMIVAVHAQYVVTGGQGTPYLQDDKTNRVHVYLVDGMNNVTISYTSSSSFKHQWYKYKVKALESEPVSSEQNGMTSVIRSVEDGYGYYVDDPALQNIRWYVWIIDYSKYLFNPQGLTVKYGDCSNVRLAVSPEVPDMSYNLPSGSNRLLEREFDISYQTLKWSDENLRFSPEAVKITGKSASTANLPSVPAPLCDTEFTLAGDQFARHFDKEKKLTTDTYQAVAVEVHADTTLIMDNALNMTVSEGGLLSAPAEVRFKAYANEPVASMYIWKIYRQGEEENPLVRFTGAEVDYTFNEAGDFIASLEVSDRTTTCTETPETFTIKVSTSDLDVPNAFSPGTTPGINDEFRVAYKSLVDYKISIFNRWGVELYRSTSPAQGWDGKKGGKYVPPGVYFYVIEAKGSDGRKFNKKGSINILRPKTIDDQIIEE